MSQTSMIQSKEISRFPSKDLREEKNEEDIIISTTIESFYKGPSAITHLVSPEKPFRSKRMKVASEDVPALVTPLTLEPAHFTRIIKSKTVRRALVPVRQVSNASLEPLKPLPSILNTSCEKESCDLIPEKEKKRLPFGREVIDTIPTLPVKSVTRKVYHLVNKMTGSIGGNGHGGAIYGELTVGSMQKMVELMKIHTNFGPESRFIDVGSGLGKPNLHVSQDPGVEFSYGIEMEHVRWMLGMSNLNKVLEAAQKQGNDEDQIGHRCIFQHGDITEAERFDPFSHVYMFDIGFPPKLFKQLGKMFNRSQSPYLICYHGPRLMVDRYGFDVELIIQASTSMHGSSENHTGYIYRRAQAHSKKGRKNMIKNKCPVGCEDLPHNVPCDPLFVDAWRSTRRDIKPLLKDVNSLVTKSLSSQRPSRKRKATKQFTFEG